MTIRIIAEGLYDTAHAVFEANEIHRLKPDAVFFELPVTPFQEVFDNYSSDKYGIDGLKRHLFSAIKKSERHIDHELAKKVAAGQIEAEELEAIEKEGREIHVMQAAKKARAEMYAMDMPLEELEKEFETEAEREHLKNVKHVLKTKKLPPLIWELNELMHYPFYVMERLVRHHGISTMNPYRHNVNHCKICMAGAAYDRAATTALFGLLHILPFSPGVLTEFKFAYLMKKVDFIREKYMASVISKKYRQLKAKLRREPRILAIVHLWNAASLKWMLKDLE